jgi:lysophospholipase L1-like esterase
MLAAFTQRFANWFRGPSRARLRSAAPRCAGRRVRPAVEALEDRCLLSGTPPLDVSVPLGDVLMALNPNTNAPVIFLGDSITWNYAFGGGASVWDRYMAPLGAADYGVSGQTTQSLLYQLGLGQLVGSHPSIVVLMIGTNDLAQGTPPLLTAVGIVADVNAIHFYLPDTKVLVLGTPPAGASPNDPLRVAVNQTNSILSNLLAGDPHATYLNISPALENADGTIPPSVMPDGFHPTDLGFLYLTSAIYPTIYQAIQAHVSTPPATYLPTLNQV